MDLLSGYELIVVVINNLTDRRKDSDPGFSDIFKSSTDYSNILYKVINIPRINARQQNLGNISAETPEE